MLSSWLAAQVSRVSAASPRAWIGCNPVWDLSDPADPRLAFYRLAKKRDHRLYSALNDVALKQNLNLVLHLTAVVTRRALQGEHEVVSIVATDEILQTLESLIEARRLLEGVYVVSREMYEDLVGLAVNEKQCCAALTNMAPATSIAVAPPPVTDSRDLTRSQVTYIWDGSPVGLDRSEASRTIRPPILVLDDVRSADNIGVLARTAYSLGVRSIVATPTSFSAIGCRAARTSMGALSFFAIYRADNAVETIKALQQNGIRVLATSPRGNSVVAPQRDRHWALVVGNEDTGSSDEVLQACSEQLVIPQVAGDSLSVSVACGIALYELLRDDLVTCRAPEQ